MGDLLALSRAELASAKTLLALRFRFHAATAASAVAALIFDPPATYWLALGGLIAEVAAWVIRVIARQRAERGNHGLRLTMLHRNLAYDNRRESVRIRAAFSRFAKKEASNYADEAYWRADGTPGPERLRTALQESAFWSANLYRKAALAPTIKSAVVAGAATLALLVVALGEAEDVTATVARLAVVLFGFLIASDLVGEALDFRAAAGAASNTEDRLDSVDMTALGCALEVFSDYALATGTAPPISDRLWKKQKSGLESLWDERRAESDP